MPRRILCGYGIDVDAVAGWINTQNGTASDVTNQSRGVFGATVGVDRLLKLWEKYNIKTTWFIPAHTVESFPKQMIRIRNAGHEIGLHGYTHEFVSQLSEEQERDVLKKSIDTLTKLTGKKPKGWTAPAWTPSRHSLRLLEEAGIIYDHSFMHHDCQLYRVPYPSLVSETDHRQPAAHWMTPMSTITPSSIIEVPANWHLDDWPAFQPKPALGSAGFVDPHHVERFWREHFEFCYREHDSFVFPLSIHPQVSGKPQVMLMHERLIEWINTHDGVEWCTFEQMVEEYRAGRMGGVTVEGGVDV